jgi:hypothetical protein
MSTWYGVTTPSFQPAMRVITNITQSNPAIITTGINHLYINDMVVRIDMYPQFLNKGSAAANNGMIQMNQQFGTITVLSPTTFAIPIDSTNFDAFVLAPIPTAQAVPIAEANSILTAAVQNVPPGGNI